MTKINTITTDATIDKLRETFCRWGIPEVVVSDNDPSSISMAFEDFLKRNGIRHLTSASFYPASNGVAEIFNDLKVQFQKIKANKYF